MSMRPPSVNIRVYTTGCDFISFLNGLGKASESFSVATVFEYSSLIALTNS